MQPPQPIAHSSFACPSRLAVVTLVILVGLVFIPIQATAAPLINWPATLHFGEVSVGQTETQLVTLTNNAQQSITITGIGVANSEFSVVPMTMPIILGAGQSIDVGVNFAPTATGWVGGNISFVASPASNNIVVQAMGMGCLAQH